MSVFKHGSTVNASHMDFGEVFEEVRTWIRIAGSTRADRGSDSCELRGSVVGNVGRNPTGIPGGSLISILHMCHRVHDLRGPSLIYQRSG
ncbi:hypothetical protein CC1G_15108 [Coprinopsis cinerea okayama7|uniref:Uncharacterized protein n=1 Tax=Coprinopsis cinerea (strain Okayama-7 / 130 / ATCC MYA-4618 / FGSC 9003) TaxID=240176 RepID=D6RPH0_COPC7|nr:hypothetical protein CC1G_15108 [Coprinopsis cinerea okayama7\|eukprot:XP_002910467.1 hypothetical protein CC1G_15108 [Coprinopsis cinerea okayama7\